MNKTVNKFLLVGDKFLPEMHLRQLRFTYSNWDHLQKTKKEYKSSKKEKIRNIFIKTNYIKLVFNGMAHREFEDLTRRTA